MALGATGCNPAAASSPSDDGVRSNSAERKTGQLQRALFSEPWV
jgi:hypothetical protein